MIKVGKYTNIDRGSDSMKEYYINQDGIYISLTKAELENIASDLKSLGITDGGGNHCHKCGQELCNECINCMSFP